MLASMRDDVDDDARKTMTMSRSKKHGRVGQMQKLAATEEMSETAVSRILLMCILNTRMTAITQGRKCCLLCCHPTETKYCESRHMENAVKSITYHAGS